MCSDTFNLCFALRDKDANTIPIQIVIQNYGKHNYVLACLWM
jgi:hypothetical protein